MLPGHLAGGMGSRWPSPWLAVLPHLSPEPKPSPAGMQQALSKFFLHEVNGMRVPSKL